MSYGRDGTFYKDDKERIRADKRYEQQERRIKEQRKTNELLKKQMRQDKEKQFYNSAQNYADMSWKELFVILKSTFYLVCVIFFIPVRFTDVTESFSNILNIILLIFGILAFFDIRKIILKYNVLKNNHSTNSKNLK